MHMWPREQRHDGDGGARGSSPTRGYLRDLRRDLDMDGVRPEREPRHPTPDTRHGDPCLCLCLVASLSLAPSVRPSSLVRSFALSPLRSLARSFARSLARSLTHFSLTRSRQGDPVSVFPTRPPQVAARRRKRRARHLRVVGGPRRSSSCPSSLPSVVAVLLLHLLPLPFRSRSRPVALSGCEDARDPAVPSPAVGQPPRYRVRRTPTAEAAKSLGCTTQ